MGMYILQYMFWLFTKHFVVDFLLQTPFQYLNKGKYLHTGGLVHCVLHGIASFIITAIMFDASIAKIVFFIDCLVHYHIDYAKVKINTYFKLKPDNSEKYWWLLGFDQFLHSLTYIYFGYLVISK